MLSSELKQVAETYELGSTNHTVEINREIIENILSLKFFISEIFYL
jgi:hypothetical protein